MVGLFRWFKLWMLIPAAIVSAAVVIAVVLVTTGRPTAANFQIENCTGGDDAARYDCLQKRYQTMTQKQGPEAAFSDLKAIYPIDNLVKSQCHQLAHVIGRAGAKKYPDVSEAYTHGDNFCWSGYYHGVMETIAAKIGPSQIEAKANDICSTLRKQQPYSFYHYNCVHGLGHGFMEIKDDELFTALGTCNSLTDSWERQSCYGGVFMENVMVSITPGKTTKYLKTDDLMYPCNAVDHDYKEQCYLMQTSHALKQVNNDFGKVFGLCDGVESDFRPTCYQSLGRDASGSTVSDPVQTANYCQLGSSQPARDNCVVGAVKDFISYFHSDVQAKQFCDGLPQTEIEVCRITAKEYYKGFNK